MAKSPTVTKELQAALRDAMSAAEAMRHEFITLEHLLLALIDDQDAAAVMRACSVDLDKLHWVEGGVNERSPLGRDVAEPAPRRVRRMTKLTGG